MSQGSAKEDADYCKDVGIFEVCVANGDDIITSVINDVKWLSRSSFSSDAPQIFLDIFTTDSTSITYKLYISSGNKTNIQYALYKFAYTGDPFSYYKSATPKTSIPDDYQMRVYAENVKAASLATPRAINGTSFDGTENITTKEWGTSRTLTVGNKAQTTNGSSDVSWSLHDILYNHSAVDATASWNITEPGVYSVKSDSTFAGDGNPEVNEDGSGLYKYGQLIVFKANNDGMAQFYISHHDSDSANANRGIRFRTGYNNVYRDSWRVLLDSVNYTKYTVNKVGEGATGIWGIDISGNAATASQLKTARDITLTGDVEGTIPFDGSENISIHTSLSNGAVSTEKVADGAITNVKLNNDSVSIAGNSVPLGGAIDATTLKTSLGLSNALHFIGVATVDIEDGSKTDPNIDGYTTQTAGDVIIDRASAYEYIWTGSKWERLGPDGSYKTIQEVVYDPTADGNSSSFIKTITQDENGVISATKASLANFTIGGLTYNGSTAVTLNTLGVSYGGTGNTTLASGEALIGNGLGAITTRAITNNVSKVAVTASTNLITANTLYYHSGNSNLTTVGTITSGTWQGSTLQPAYGGTGQTTLQASANSLINALGTSTASVLDNEYYIVQASSSSTTYYRKQLSTLWTYIKGKLNLSTSSVGSSTTPIYWNGSNFSTCGSSLAVSITGSAASATKATQDGSGNTISSYYCTLSTAQTIGGAKTFQTSPVVNNYSPCIYLKNTITNSNSTYSRAYLECSSGDVASVWIDSSASTTAYNRRAISVYGFASTSNMANALMFRECNSSGTWTNNIMIYHQKNLVYSSTQPAGVSGMIWLKPA